MGDAAILCTKCGTASDAAVSTCGKCGGRNARVCGACGFQNSVAKNYCDKCGSSLAELGRGVSPPPSPAWGDIPQTAVRRPEAGASPGLPALPSAGRAESPYPYVSADPWSAPPPPPPREAPRPRWNALRALLNGLAAVAGTVAAGAVIWFWFESRRPEKLVPRLAERYLEALRTGDLETAYGLLTEGARRHATLDDFRASRASEPWSWSGLEIERSEPDAVLLRYRLETPRGARPDRLLFVRENGRWARPYNWTLLSQAGRAFARGDAESGAALAKTAAEVDPRDPVARAHLCEAAYFRKPPEEAARHCEEALRLAQLYPSNLSPRALYRLHGLLADTLRNALGRPEKAVEQYAQMLSFADISPVDQCEILLARADAYRELGRPGEAASDLSRAEQLCATRAAHEQIRRLRDVIGVPN